ncbi:MAG: HNH endonuclease family protein, partial [Gammaproteobacteria bacterium]|nr:HNH endonuclease family protein [Gammaproteobacteria bacterium]
IGNLTLVNGKLNSALSNAAWDEKRSELSNHSVLFLNKSLVNEGPEVWDESEIAKRAESLHRAAVQAWPYWTDL